MRSIWIWELVDVLLQRRLYSFAQSSGYEKIYAGNIVGIVTVMIMITNCSLVYAFLLEVKLYNPLCLEL